MPAHIADLIAQDPKAGWILIVDQLNTHQSESLVRLVATQCQLSEDLGIKGKSGILESMASRAAFLSHPDHRIRFVYLPKHTSWLNQIECWFSILVRRLLRRGNFISTDNSLAANLKIHRLLQPYVGESFPLEVQRI